MKVVQFEKLIYYQGVFNDLPMVTRCMCIVQMRLITDGYFIFALFFLFFSLFVN